MDTLTQGLVFGIAVAIFLGFTRISCSKHEFIGHLELLDSLREIDLETTKTERNTEASKVASTKITYNVE